ncbi:hypothetical protein [Cohnella zeiphila]|uniref:Uncharacterized protein n=1 Tax=Cohnella zeiphila TaxID=2761120 RepID=A0A7X0SPC3_9BACL|nr:hypothetical protein [Cohnella zeiphila]
MTVRCKRLLLVFKDSGAEPESQEHTIQNRMAPGHESKRFTILGFGYVS